MMLGNVITYVCHFLSVAMKFSHLLRRSTVYLKCEKKEQETLLFKCAGCKTAMYCSRECQTSSWKTGEHRLKCKEWQELWFRACCCFSFFLNMCSRTQICVTEIVTGMGMSAGALMFLRLVALAELRRHMPGVSEHLATFNNPSGIPLKDAVFHGLFPQRPADHHSPFWRLPAKGPTRATFGARGRRTRSKKVP